MNWETLRLDYDWVVAKALCNSSSFQNLNAIYHILISLSNTISWETQPLRRRLDDGNPILTNQRLVSLNRMALSEWQAQRMAKS